MKQIAILTLLVVGLAAHNPSLAQSVEGIELSLKRAPSHSIVFNPLGLILSQVGGKYAVKVSRHVALTIPFAFQYVGGVFSGSFHTAGWGGSLGFGTKIFLSDEALKSGWFLEPHVVAGYSRWAEVNHFSLVPSFTAGYGWVMDSGLTINLGLGLGTALHWMSGNSISVYPWPDFEASLGYSW